MDERERRTVERRLREAHLPLVKTLDDFDFGQAPKIPLSLIRTLAEGAYINSVEPVVLIGDYGTGRRTWRLGCAWRPAGTSDEWVYDGYRSGQ